MAVALGIPQLRSGRLPTEGFPQQGALVDSFGREATDLRISLTDKCNLRCTYCMPEEGLAWLPKDAVLSPGEVARLVRIAARSLGVRELRLTGGEPLIRPDLEEVIAGVHSEFPDLPISMTTNGIGLEKRADGLREAGLQRINVSLDTVCPDTFRRLARRGKLQSVLTGIAAAQAVGLSPVKLNAVLMRGVNDSQALELLDWALDHDCQLRFIEQMPLDADRGWTRENLVSAAEIRAQLEAKYRLEVSEEPRDGAPAERWNVLDPRSDERLGTVGIIASVTEPFCADCRRTRVTAEGKVRSCLFSHEEYDLMGLLRSGASDSEVEQTWRAAMWIKPKAHGMDHVGLDSEEYVQPERSMSAIGG